MLLLDIRDATTPPLGKSFQASQEKLDGLQGTAGARITWYDVVFLDLTGRAS